MRIIVLTAVAGLLALAPLAPAGAAQPLPPQPPSPPGPIAAVYWSQVRTAHVAWSRSVVTAAAGYRWAELARLRTIHPALVDPGCNNTIPSMALERMATSALRLAAVRRGDGADRTARRYVRLAGDYARDAVRNMPQGCVP